MDYGARAFDKGFIDYDTERGTVELGVPDGSNPITITTSTRPSESSLMASRGPNFVNAQDAASQVANSWDFEQGPLPEFFQTDHSHNDHAAEQSAARRTSCWVTASALLRRNVSG